MKNIIYILTVLLFGCSNNPKDFIGHWHKTIDSNGLYHTITITDSSIFLDEYTFGGEYLFNDNLGDTIFIAGIYLFKDSDNNIIGFDEPIKWNRIKQTKNDFIKDLSCNLFVEYIPQETLSEKTIDSVPNLVMPIFIGKPKSQFKELFSESELFTKKGFYFQFGDLLLSYNDLVEVIMQSDPRKYYLLICSDKNCPNELIEEVIELKTKYKPDLIIYRAKINRQKQKIVIE